MKRESLKIVLEVNPEDIDDCFSVTINGTKLANVKRFYLDWDMDKLNEKDERGVMERHFDFGVEFRDYGEYYNDFLTEKYLP